MRISFSRQLGTKINFMNSARVIFSLFEIIRVIVWRTIKFLRRWVCCWWLFVKSRSYFSQRLFCIFVIRRVFRLACWYRFKDRIAPAKWLLHVYCLNTTYIGPNQRFIDGFETLIACCEATVGQNALFSGKLLFKNWNGYMHLIKIIDLFIYVL